MEEEAKRALIENERAKEEAEGERRKLVELWHTPYTGGTVYCDQEVWTYTASGHAQVHSVSSLAPILLLFFSPSSVLGVMNIFQRRDSSNILLSFSFSYTLLIS